MESHDHQKQHPIATWVFHLNSPEQLRRVARIGLTVVVWLALGIILLTEYTILTQLGYRVPTVGWVFPVSMGICLMFLIWHKHGWQAIESDVKERFQRRVEEKIRTMDDAELLKMRYGVNKMQVKMGAVTVEESLEAPDMKAKRQHIDEVVSQLSDEELIALREQLQQAQNVTDVKG